MSSHDESFEYLSYWRHPESDCIMAIPKNEIRDFMELVELSLEDYLKQVTEGKELPKDIKGILKNAEWGKAPFPKDILQGDLYFNPQGQFPNGIRIHTSRVTDVRSDGVYCTLHSKYFVQFKPGEERRSK